MKSTKTFNNVSSKLLASIPKFKKGEVKTFQMLNGVPNPEPDEKERSRSPLLYGKKQIQTSFRVYDIHQTDETGAEVGGYVDIGCVERWNRGEPETYRFFMPGMGEYVQFQGKFSLMGGNIRDEELFEILWLSPEREGSPCADSAITPLFRLIDVKAENNAITSKVQTLKEAMKIADSLNEKEQRAIMAGLNQPNYQDKDVLAIKIQELATDPKYSAQFIKAYNDPNRDLKGDLKAALDQEVIKHDMASGQVFLGNVKLTVLKVDDITSLINSLTQWINTAENGKDVLANIRKQLKGEVKTA